jgi:hypothetical protein
VYVLMPQCEPLALVGSGMYSSDQKIEAMYSFFLGSGFGVNSIASESQVEAFSKEQRSASLRRLAGC